MPHDWNKMVNNVQNHVKSINWSYKKGMISKDTDYYNYFATFEDKNTINLNHGQETIQVTADHIIIAVGGRPTQTGTPGEIECTISSDDLFTLKKSPGKTLFNGGGFIGLECAGFLTGLGYETTVIARSILLGDSSFDQDFVKMIGNHMCGHGTRILLHTEIESYRKE
jgi:pyruvate/2-oxoglutarate dehydrogenase complex dihydrolipoamide dehydrogenase (E3) component